jgi:excisionase family DNA binding protein
LSADAANLHEKTHQRKDTITMNSPAETTSARITVPEIAKRLSIGRLAVYSMLEHHLIPAIRIGRRWLVTRFAYEEWERRCGMKERVAC